MRPRPWLWLWKWCGAALSLWSLLAHAAPAWDEVRRFPDFHHTAWTSEEGAPGDTWAIVQTTDGWLWLGGPRGLFRFDGVQFEQVPLQGRPAELNKAIYTLFADDSGALWIGFNGDGAGRLKDGQFQYFGEAEGIPSIVTAFARDLDGTLWASTPLRSLLRFDGERWHPVTAADGRAVSPVTMHVDQQGTLWMADDDRIYYLPRGSSTVQSTDITVNQSVGFLRALDGRSWYEDALGAHLLPDQTATARRGPGQNAVEPFGGLFDGEGYFWAIRGGFLRRFPAPDGHSHALIEDRENTDRFTTKDGLSGLVHSMIEDREGNIWVATSAGIDRFRRTNIRKLPFNSDGINSYALAPAPGGGIWFGNGYAGREVAADPGLWKFDGQLTRAATGRAHDVEALVRDTSGVLWGADIGGVWRMRADGRIDTMPPLPEPARGRLIGILAVDATRTPWVTVIGKETYRLRDGAWQLNGNLAALQQKQRPTAYALDEQQRLWLGYRNELALVKDDQVTLYGAAQGLSVGPVEAISVGRHTVVVGPSRLAVLNDNRFTVLTPVEDPSAFDGIQGIVETHDGDVWLNGFRGLVRVANNAIETALRNGNTRVPVEVFDAQDGYPGTAESVRPEPTMIAADDGRLWFVGTLGVGSLHPQRVHRNPLPPDVHIRSVIAGDRAHGFAETLQFPKGTQDLQINYTALSLARPERIRFKYRLDGYDQAWVDAETRRQAFYTNLEPGQYRFRVIAANENGLWNERGRSLNILIPPKFIQTKLFLALCIVATLSLGWAVVALRIRQVTRRERSRLEERLSERERIARELHDTLLQGIQGLLLRFQTVADQIGADEKARSTMEQALERADALLIEGRDRVKDLRSATDAPVSLRQALLDAAEQMPRQSARLRVIETGAVRELHPIVREEVARIAIEAMLNAVHHAAATTIDVELFYDRKHLCIVVKDDGRGMEEAVLTNGRHGHFGLIGMRERAKRIRGRLSVLSRPEAGTEVRLYVPASMAYLKDRVNRRGQQLA